jgi:uncharacterized protein
VFGVLYWLYRNRERLGSSGRYALDPVCGMQVEMAHAPAAATRDGQRIYFCSDRCAERFGSEQSDHAEKGSAAWTHSE